jgi:hypothetical protein
MTRARRARLRLFLAEHAPDERPHAEQREQRRCCRHRAELFGVAVAEEGEVPPGEGAAIWAQSPHTLQPVEVVRLGDGEQIGSGVRLVEADDSLRLVVRKRPEQHAFATLKIVVDAPIPHGQREDPRRR